MPIRSSTRVLALLCLLAAPLAHPQQPVSPYDAVDPRIGTAGGGNTFPGATLPFGMVQWSPDTNTEAWYSYNQEAKSGHAAANSILGFSLMHLSGAGCPLYGDFAVLPATQELTASPSDDLTPYAQAFAHENEQEHPAFYAVTLNSGVRVEITVTDRAGIARFTFPPGLPARLLVNATSSANGDSGAISLIGTDRYETTAHAGHFCSSNSHYTVFGEGQFDKPFSKSVLWRDDTLAGDARSASGKRAGAWLDFGDVSQVQLKVAVSFVDAQGARDNLQREIPGWNFDAVHARAVQTWSALLNRLAVQGGTADQRTKFYTGVYHSFLSPTLFSDDDGRTIGFDHAIHRLAPGQGAQYANFSDWDIYRNTVQLQALFEPARESDMLQSLVNDAVESGQLPRWEAANDVTYVMGGDSPAPVIASAYAFGAQHFDTATALRYMVKASTDTRNNRERPFLDDYLKLGYIPDERDGTSVSRTLEYASDDFAAGQFALSLGQSAEATRFLKLSENWKHLLDPATGFARPRRTDGTWLPGFDAELSLPKRPTAPETSDQDGFEEGNTWQYTYMVPYDYPALFAAIGGEDKVNPRLDRFFEHLRCWGKPCYNIENEPDFVVPYAYIFAGQPWKTQEVVTRLGEEVFKATPDGIPGNDDLGATSGVYVWDALGMYPAVPGVGGVALGTPLFDNATLRLGGAKTLTISRRGKGIYVKDVILNGKPLPTDWLDLSSLRPGENTLTFEVRSTPDTRRGTEARNRPRSFR